ncbi:MAG TPA: methionyl-tRNA formyltransferase [Thermoanaerobaculia bacterium]|nr:methionyl-tRNA formyltransferase [Thermoanaerobaculia bacterium]
MLSRVERLAFFGTPDFALPTLQALVSAGRAPLVVVTQPDRPAGRGQKVQAPVVARWAREQGIQREQEIEVWQPPRVRDAEVVERVRALQLDLVVVAAFGQIFPRELLAAPRLGCINVHASLLPRHRGAAPVQAALLAGDDETGVSIMRMEEGLDTGPVLLQGRTRLVGHETAGELLPRLAHLGAALMLEALAGLEAGTLAETPQPSEGVTHAPRLTREQGRVDWQRPAVAVSRQLRAFTPWPGASAELAGSPIKLLAGEPLDESSEAAAGSVLGMRNGALAVACGEGTVFGVERLQRPGRRALAPEELLRGERLGADVRFS